MPKLEGVATESTALSLSLLAAREGRDAASLVWPVKHRLLPPGLLCVLHSLAAIAAEGK